MARTGLLTHLDGPVPALLAAALAGGDAQSIQVRAVGGVVNDVPAHATAYAHRHQNFSVTAITAPPLAAGLGRHWRALLPFLDGTYLSFESEKEHQHLTYAFPEPTLTRLRQIKNRWDPRGMFDHNFAVGPA